MSLRVPRLRSTLAVLVVALVALVALALSGCYRLAMPGTPGPTTTNPPHTMSAYAWGLLQDDSLDSICQGKGGLAEVTAKATPLFVLYTVVTLGFWAPVTVQTKCLTLDASAAPKGEHAGN
jgi:hypothetical protein